MKFELTYKYQSGKRCSDNKSRSLHLFFINDELVLKQKSPYDTNIGNGPGSEGCCIIESAYYLNGNIHQTRLSLRKNRLFDRTDPHRTRKVKYPISKKLIKKLEIPKDLKIKLNEDTNNRICP